MNGKYQKLTPDPVSPEYLCLAEPLSYSDRTNVSACCAHETGINNCLVCTFSFQLALLCFGHLH